jgi:hypothetical protein
MVTLASAAGSGKRLGNAAGHVFSKTLIFFLLNFFFMCFCCLDVRADTKNN